MSTLSTNRIEYEAALAALLAAYSVGEVSGTIIPERLSLIALTKTKLDEVIPEGEGIQFTVEDDVNISDPLNILINAILNEAATRVLLNAPIHYLSPVKSDKTATQDAGDSKIGFIELPDNFLRFISLKMADWKRQVIQPIRPETDIAKYRLQSNKYLRGGVAKPVAVLTHRTISAAQKKVIEYYSVDTSHVIDWLYYIQETAAQDVQINLHHALTWAAAAMVLQITERGDLAKLAFDRELECYKL